MARPPAKELTERELEIMHVFWECEQATAAEVRDALAQRGRDALVAGHPERLGALIDENFDTRLKICQVQTLQTINAQKTYMVQAEAQTQSLKLKQIGSEQLTAQYTLEQIPIVYHILANQDQGAPGSPTATHAQLEFMTQKTNELFNIYDKSSQTHLQWASFKYNSRIVHTDVQF